MPTTYKVSFLKTRVTKGKRGTTHRVRWMVAGSEHGETFKKSGLAQSFRAALVTAARAGEPFDIETGLPPSLREAGPAGPTWLENAIEFVDMKWADISPNHRESTAKALVTLTVELVLDGVEYHDDELLRRALRNWSFNTGARKNATAMPTEFVEPLKWISSNSLPLTALSDPMTLRRAYAAIGRNLDGSKASSSTINRKRAALSSALVFAVELNRLDSNPMRSVKLPRSRASVRPVDQRSVINPTQAAMFLREVKRIAPKLHAYFGAMYYAALRPAEARNLKRTVLVLPKRGWGEITFGKSFQFTPSQWTDSGAYGEERGLKHREEDEWRRVPIPPQLVADFREHIYFYGTGAGDRLFVTRVGKRGMPLSPPYGGPVSSAAGSRVLQAARKAILTPEQQASPLVARQYDLRHAAVSTWLAAGVPAPLVAEWAGHSVQVLLTIYAHALEGQEEVSKQRIDAALKLTRP